jgi:hypothetical protein
MWLNEEDRAKARAMRLKAAADGERRPLNVMAGNYRPLRGVCPWWDAARAAG